MGSGTRNDRQETGFAIPPLITNAVYATMPGTDTAGIQQLTGLIDSFRQVSGLVQRNISCGIFL
jgi:hypothetical protein